jgi:SHS2 domain-containing protein
VARRARGRSRRWGSFPTTADVGLWARGDTPAALFEAMGLGLFALETDLRKVRPREERTVRATGIDLPSLVVAYLTALLDVGSADGFLPREIDARLLGDPPNEVVATLRGEPFDLARHSRRMEVKAATYHRLEIDLAGGRARVIVDI